MGLTSVFPSGVLARCKGFQYWIFLPSELVLVLRFWPCPCPLVLCGAGRGTVKDSQVSFVSGVSQV